MWNAGTVAPASCSCLSRIRPFSYTEKLCFSSEHRGEELVYTEVQMAMGYEFPNKLSIELAVTARW